MHFIFMGVAGCGKSTYAERAAQHFELPFFEGDDFHPLENVEKMRSGAPLNDKDREAWIEALSRAVSSEVSEHTVVSCSALNPNVRSMLASGCGGDIVYIWLTASFETIEARLKQRENHFMGAEMLRSQFDALSPPGKAHIVSVESAPDDVFAEIQEIFAARLCH